MAMKRRRRELAWGTVAGWVVLLLALGCVTSVGLVWVLSFTRPGPVGKGYFGYNGAVRLGDRAAAFSISVATMKSPWCTARYFRFYGRDDNADQDSLAQQFALAAMLQLPPEERRWETVRALEHGRVSDGGEVWEYWYGWPWRCVMMTHGSLDPVRNPKPWDYVGAFHFNTPLLSGWRPSGWRGASFVALPYMPLRRGLALDTLAFGAAWLIVLLTLRTGRNALRRRRGRCPACGYDLAGDLGAGCPECGWGRAPARLSPHP